MIVSALCGLLAAAAPHEVTGRVFPCGVSESFVVNEREPVHWLEYRVPGGIGHIVNVSWEFGLISNAAIDMPDEPNRLHFYWADSGNDRCWIRHNWDLKAFRIFLRFHGPIPKDWRSRSVRYQARHWPHETVNQGRFADELFKIRGVVGFCPVSQYSDECGVRIAAERLDKQTVQLLAMRLALAHGIQIDRFELAHGYDNCRECFDQDEAVGDRFQRMEGRRR